MKANVTIPSSLGQAAERLAKQQEEITNALNQVYATETSTLDSEITKVQLALFDRTIWE